MKTSIRCLLAFWFALPLLGTEPSPNAGETSLNLDIAFGIRHVPDSRVTVPVGELVRMNSYLNGNYLQWYKNGRPIPGATESQFVLSNAEPSDAGSYTARNNDPAATMLPLTNIQLSVGSSAPKLINSSTRATVDAGERTLVGGFVVSGSGSKKLIIRAVGPSLSLFGIQNPLAQPVIRIFDNEGKPFTEAYVYPPVVGGPTYESDLRESLAKAGAFPLPEGSRDAVEMRPFKSGNYTVYVSGIDGGGGVVLLEIYEVP